MQLLSKSSALGQRVISIVFKGPFKARVDFRKDTSHSTTNINHTVTMLARTILTRACKVVNAMPKRSFSSLVTRSTRSENITSQKLTTVSNNIFSARQNLLLNNVWVMRFIREYYTN
jgi:hypothetical protein